MSTDRFRPFDTTLDKEAALEVQEHPEPGEDLRAGVRGAFSVEHAQCLVLEASKFAGVINQHLGGGGVYSRMVCRILQRDVVRATEMELGERGGG